MATVVDVLKRKGDSVEPEPHCKKGMIPLMVRLRIGKEFPLSCRLPQESAEDCTFGDKLRRGKCREDCFRRKGRKKDIVNVFRGLASR